MHNRKTSDRILIVLVEPAKKPVKKVIENDLAAMQSLVGGWIENVTIGSSGDARIGIMLNEEGKLIDLPMNRIVHGRGGSDVFVGNFFVTAYNEEGDQCSLTEEEADHFVRRFSSIEVYLR